MNEKINVCPKCFIHFSKIFEEMEKKMEKTLMSIKKEKILKMDDEKKLTRSSSLSFLNNLNCILNDFISKIISDLKSKKNQKIKKYLVEILSFTENCFLQKIDKIQKVNKIKKKSIFKIEKKKLKTNLKILSLEKENSGNNLTSKNSLVNLENFEYDDNDKINFQEFDSNRLVKICKSKYSSKLDLIINAKKLKNKKIEKKKIFKIKSKSKNDIKKNKNFDIKIDKIRNMNKRVKKKQKFKKKMNFEIKRNNQYFLQNNLIKNHIQFTSLEKQQHKASSRNNFESKIKKIFLQKKKNNSQKLKKKRKRKFSKNSKENSVKKNEKNFFSGISKIKKKFFRNKTQVNVSKNLENLENLNNFKDDYLSENSKNNFIFETFNDEYVSKTLKNDDDIFSVQKKDCLDSKNLKNKHFFFGNIIDEFSENSSKRNEDSNKKIQRFENSSCNKNSLLYLPCKKSSRNFTSVNKLKMFSNQTSKKFL